MLLSLSALRQRLKSRTDSEHEQSIIRIVINIICVLYFTAILYIEGVTEDRVFSAQAVAMYFIVSLGIFLHILYKPQKNAVRRCVGIISDMSIISFALYNTGAVAFVAFPLYLWVSIGNGLRFGQAYLIAAVAASVIGFSFTFAFSPYLHEQRYMGIGILLSLIALPIYYSILINRLNISNRRLNELLEKTSIMATHDNLTGLANRNLFYDRLNQAIKLFQRSQQECTVLFIDLDGFKPINDKLGHVVGDKLLKQVADRIIKNIRNYDTASRFGGDEFVLLIENIDLKKAKKIAHKILNAISQRYSVEGNNLIITASIGVTAISDCGANVTISNIIQNADNAMYQAKTKGKNQIHIHDCSPTPTESTKTLNPALKLAKANLD